MRRLAHGQNPNSQPNSQPSCSFQTGSYTYTSTMKAMSQEPALSIRNSTASTLGLLLMAVMGLLCTPALAADPPPNIILILADDFGYECVGANGGTSYRTPVLDQLAATGVRFEHCYVQPLCTPTRVQLMTGLYNVAKLHHVRRHGPAVENVRQPVAGGRLRHVHRGKWQLGQRPGAAEGISASTRPASGSTRAGRRATPIPVSKSTASRRIITKGEYGPDLVNDYALDFITRHKAKPFFLYYPMMLTHAPYQPTPDSADWDPKAQGEKVNQDKKHFADMTAYMDKLIGKVVAQLDALGPPRAHADPVRRRQRHRDGARFRKWATAPWWAAKGTTTAAGMHVPLIANWPGKVPAGKVVGDLVDSTDFFPTICAAAGVPIPAGLDGAKLFPATLRPAWATTRLGLLLVFTAPRAAGRICI